MSGVHRFTELVLCDVSMNLLTNVRDILRLETIQHLVLHTNAIRELPALASLRHLRYLDVSSNCLTSIEAVTGHASLEVLNVSRNVELSAIRPAGTVIALRSFTFQDCNQASIDGLGGLPHLVLLDALRNNITKLSDTCTVLTTLPSLRNVVFKGNGHVALDF
jgi:Leucine-rich repeat (LRR) protein